MPRRASLHPTQAELEILNVLWRRGSSTVRQVHETLRQDGTTNTALTTTLKMLQLMVDKRLVIRSNTRPHQYVAAIEKGQTQTGLLDDLVRRAFDGSVQTLVMRAVEDADLGGDELEALQKLIDNMRHQNRGEK